MMTVHIFRRVYFTKGNAVLHKACLFVRAERRFKHMVSYIATVSACSSGTLIIVLHSKCIILFNNLARKLPFVLDNFLLFELWKCCITYSLSVCHICVTHKCVNLIENI